jgi:hypothetical protein
LPGSVLREWRLIKDFVLVETNKHLDEKLTLSEFYKWLGCMFYMACYVMLVSLPSIFGGQRRKRACLMVPPFAARMSCP